MENIAESDWKKIRALKDEALNKASGEILNKVKTLLEKQNSSAHEIYLELYQLIEREDKNIELMFDELKRSTAYFKLASWKRFGVINDQDLGQFTPETQRIIKDMRIYQ